MRRGHHRHAEAHGRRVPCSRRSIGVLKLLITGLLKSMSECENTDILTERRIAQIDAKIRPHVLHATHDLFIRELTVERHLFA